MARAAMTVQTRPGPYAIVPVDLTAMPTVDNVNGMTVPVNGATELIFINTTAGAITVTIHSAPDPYGRSGDITAYSVGVNHCAIFQEFPQAGWAQAGSNLMNVDASATGLSYLAIARNAQ